MAQDLIFYQNKKAQNDYRDSEIVGFVNTIFTGDLHNEDGYDSSVDDLVWRTKFGQTFSLTLTYNF